MHRATEYCAHGTIQRGSSDPPATNIGSRAPIYFLERIKSALVVRLVHAFTGRTAIAPTGHTKTRTGAVAVLYLSASLSA